MLQPLLPLVLYSYPHVVANQLLPAKPPPQQKQLQQQNFQRLALA
jgi:hypothetical protein